MTGKQKKQKPRRIRNIDQKKCCLIVKRFKAFYGLTNIELEKYIGIREKWLVKKIKGQSRWKLSEQYLIMNFMKPKLKKQ